jgi:cupin 2 domain-containing protein
MTLSVCNLLASQPSAFDAEVSETLVTAQGIRLKRILSLGQTSSEGFWYDQEEAEWVIVLTGGARLTIAEESEDHDLGPGDAMYLPAGCRHRVAWTDPARPTVWLALFVDAQLCPSASGPMETSNIPRE